MEEKSYGNNHENGYPNESTIHFNPVSTLITCAIVIALSIISLYNYLLFHCIAEGFSIVIACGIFMVVWNSRQFLENNFFIIVGIAYLFIAGIDFFHALTYKGIDIFPQAGTNLTTQLWVGARYLQSISLIAACLLIGRKIRINIIIGFYIILTLLILLSVFYWKNFPDCFIEGSGLTVFKKISEFIISFLFLISIMLLNRRKKDFDPYILNLTISSIIIVIASELNFTFYETVYSLPNLMGHLLKIVSFYVIYKAIIVYGLKDPFNLLFRRLEQNEKALQLTHFSIDHAGDLLFWIKPDGKIYDVNETVCRKLGYSKEKLYKMYFDDICNDLTLKETVKLKENSDELKTFTLARSLVKSNGKILEMEIEFNYLNYEGEEYFCAIARDITERKRAEWKLIESEERFHNLAETAPVKIWMTDSNKMLSYCNKRWLQFTGREIDDEVGDGWMELIHPEDRPYFIDTFSKMFDERKEFTIEYRFKRYDNQYRWIVNTGIPRFTDNSFMGYIGSCVDISEIRRTREQLEISLKEKVVLLKEIHHRVKNNLQIISSLLNLQSAYIGDNEVKEIFTESQNRVKSMALIHEKLYQSGNMSEINFSEYLRELITNLLNSYRNKLSNIDLELKIDNLELNVDFSVNLGLVINELVTNTLKHAFPDGNGSGGNKSKLYVLLNVIDKRKFKIILKDNGCGFPENLDFRNTQSLGMQLVVSLVDQLKGKIELNRNGGTEFILSFNTPAPQPAS